MYLAFLWFVFLFVGQSLRLNLDDKINHRSFHFAKCQHEKYIGAPKQHNYYNLEETRRVSASRSIKYLNQCKDLCLEMHQLFPFEFKYHRLVYRQEDGDMKYITGECFYAIRLNNETHENSLDKNDENKKAQNGDKRQNTVPKQRKWFAWKNIKSFIDLSVVQDDASREQRKAWQSYTKDCEDDALKLSESSRLDFKFTVVHSDFQYYQNQGFKNIQPFDDLDQLLGGLTLPA